MKCCVLILLKTFSDIAVREIDVNKNKQELLLNSDSDEEEQGGTEDESITLHVQWKHNASVSVHLTTEN